MIAKKTHKYEPDYAVFPGETLQEVMDSLGMNQKELSARTGLTVQSLNRIIKGQQPISYETANRLELVTQVPANFWNNLEAQYQEQAVKLKERQRLEANSDFLKNIPTKELIDRRLIKPLKDKAELLRETLSFYGVSSVESWREIWENPEVAARRSKCFDSRPGPASAWIRQGELQALEIKCRPFDSTTFRKALEVIRGLTQKTPEVFEPELRRICADAGVAVALVREMKKVPWNGATKWLAPDKVMILLSIRGKGEDKFWFSFFHEAGHVLYDKKRYVFINDDSEEDPREVRANEFASEILIPSRYNDMIRCFRSKAQVRKLAGKLGIAPGIVAGRYQFLTGKWNYFKDVIKSFEWAE